MRGRCRAGKARFALHALKTHDRVDQGGIKGMAHMQAAGYVWRWDHHSKGLARGQGIGVEGTLLLPGLLPTGFCADRVVDLG